MMIVKERVENWDKRKKIRIVGDWLYGLFFKPCNFKYDSLNLCHFRFERRVFVLRFGGLMELVCLIIEGFEALVLFAVHESEECR